MTEQTEREARRARLLSMADTVVWLAGNALLLAASIVVARAAGVSLPPAVGAVADRILSLWR